jgi:hypothetical protein
MMSEEHSFKQLVTSQELPKIQLSKLLALIPKVKIVASDSFEAQVMDANNIFSLSMQWNVFHVWLVRQIFE